MRGNISAQTKPIMVNLKEYLGPYLGLIVALLYGVTSISITIFNKAVLTSYNFNYANTLALGQAVFSIFFLVVMKRMKYVDYPEFSFHVAAKAKWLILSFVGMVITGLASLAFVNIPMYSVLRRLTSVITMGGEKVMLSRIIPVDEQSSVAAMMVGAVMAGWGDLEFHVLGYILIVINCLFTAGYLIFIKKTQSLGLGEFALMYYNNIAAVPLYFCFLMSSAHAFLLNWFIFLCSTVNSPLTTSITGQLKNVITTVIGLFLFGGAPITMMGGSGLFVSTAASVWYGWIKFRQAESARKEKNKDVRVEGKLQRV